MMRIGVSVVTAAFVVGHVGAIGAEPLRDGSLCRGTEAVLFNCSVGTRVVSVCGQGGAGAVYRFGRPGQIEIEVGRLIFATTGFSGGGEAQIYGDSATNRYIVYERTVRTSFGPGGNDPRSEAGVAVQNGGKTISTRRCTTPETFASSASTAIAAGDFVEH